MRADQTKQFTQRDDGRGVARAVSLRAGVAHVGGSAQRDRVIRIQWNQQHAERAGALRLRLPVQVERIDGRGGFLARLAGFAIRAAGHGLQQLARVLEVALPEQCRAFAGEAIGRISGGAIIRDDHALGRRVAGFGAPDGGMDGVAAGFRAVVGPGEGLGWGGGAVPGQTGGESGRVR